MSRITWSITEEAADALESAANRREGESATDFALRVAAMLDEGETGTTVTVRNGSTIQHEHERVPESVLTEAHINDIAEESARRTTRELETWFR